MKGTKFQVKVWKYLKTIPKGKVKTYKQVAIGINKPKKKILRNFSHTDDSRLRSRLFNVNTLN